MFLLAPVLIAAGTGIILSSAIITSGLLGIAGFAPTLTAGTLASALHSGIGNVAAASWFATLQSAGAGGSGLTIVSAVVKAVGAAVAAAGGAPMAWEVFSGGNATVV